MTKKQKSVIINYIILSISLIFSLIGTGYSLYESIYYDGHDIILFKDTHGYLYRYIASIPTYISLIISILAISL